MLCDSSLTPQSVIPGALNPRCVPISLPPSSAACFAPASASLLPTATRMMPQHACPTDLIRPHARRTRSVSGLGFGIGRSDHLADIAVEEARVGDDGVERECLDTRPRRERRAGLVERNVPICMSPPSRRRRRSPPCVGIGRVLGWGSRRDLDRARQPAGWIDRARPLRTRARRVPERAPSPGGSFGFNRAF
jgi:hypothetical protein